MKAPHQYIKKEPNNRTIFFAGEYIDQTALAIDLGMERSYLSRILAGNRRPSLVWAAKMADALNMPMEKLVSALDIQAELYKSRARPNSKKNAA